MEELKNVFSAISFEISIELVITFLIATFLIFLGINEEVSSKQYQKKVLLTLYFLLFIVIFIFNNIFFGGIFFLCAWLISGLGLFQSQSITMEKELNILGILKYISLLWFYSAKTYILLVNMLVIYAVNFFVQQLGWPILNEWVKYLTAGIIILFCIVHFIKNTLDYFAIKKWDDVKQEIKQVNRGSQLNLEILSFLYYVEDKYLLDRKSTVYGIYDIKKGVKRNLDLYKRRISTYLSARRNRARSSLHNISGIGRFKIIFRRIFRILKKLVRVDRIFRRLVALGKKTYKKYKRGYSTLEQQVTRKTFLEPNSFQYKIRRKIFVERILNKAFIIAWRKEKTREYKKVDRKNAYEKLLWSIKYNYLRYYCISIMNNPSDINQLIKQLDKESRVSEHVLNSMYQEYIASAQIDIYKGKLEEVVENEKKYSIL